MRSATHQCRNVNKPKTTCKQNTSNHNEQKPLFDDWAISQTNENKSEAETKTGLVVDFFTEERAQVEKECGEDDDSGDDDEGALVGDLVELLQVWVNVAV